MWFEGIKPDSLECFMCVKQGKFHPCRIDFWPIYSIKNSRSKLESIWTWFPWKHKLPMLLTTLIRK